MGKCNLLPSKSTHEHQTQGDPWTAAYYRKKRLQLIGRVDGHFRLFEFRGARENFAINPTFAESFAGNSVVVEYSLSLTIRCSTGQRFRRWAAFLRLLGFLREFLKAGKADMCSMNFRRSTSVISSTYVFAQRSKKSPMTYLIRSSWATMFAAGSQAQKSKSNSGPIKEFRRFF
jgi:hypothetical protein